MISRYGATDIPVAQAVPGDFAGDRGLSALLRFAGAVLNAEATAAFARIAPQKGSKAAVQAVQGAYAHDPEERGFSEAGLPALYGWRSAGVPNDWACDVRVEEGTIMLLWVYSPAQHAQQRMREPFANALAKTLDAAIAAGAHPAWVHPLDTALADAFVRPTVVGGAPLVVAGDELDGAVGPRRLLAPRRITLTAGAVPGAYALAPVAVTAVGVDGELITENLTPPDADGGWTVEGTSEVLRILSAVFPAQPGAGAFALGHTANDRALYDGSSMAQIGGFDRIRAARWEPAELLVQLDGQQKPMRYDAVRFTVATREILERFTDDLSPHLELEGEFVHEDGAPMGAFLF